MNYYNPYFAYPYMTNAITKPGIFSRLFGGIRGMNFGSILSGTQKTLNIVNQTIPLVKQASPIVKNAKTMFRVMNEFKRVDTPITKNNIKEKQEVNNNINEPIHSNKGPTFFL